MSTHSVGSLGNASIESSTPSPSLSETAGEEPEVVTHEFKSSVTVKLTVTEVVFPDGSDTEKVICCVPTLVQSRVEFISVLDFLLKKDLFVVDKF